jgi:AraC-like DNA-binding protein
MSRPAPAPTAASHVRRVLFEAPGLSVVDFHCTAQVAPAGAEEPNPTHSIAFVRRGSFQRLHRGETLVADPNWVLFFNAAEPYQYAHPLPGGDQCTVLSLSPELALELVAQAAPGDAQRPEAPFRRGQGLVSPRAAALQYELLSLAGRDRSALELGDLAAQLADEAMRAAYAWQPERSARSALAGRRGRDLAEAAKLALNRSPASPPSLGELSRRLGCSPFHLSRTFHREMGLPLRRYLSRLRVGLAAERLARGADDLTLLALELGYADHSHFTNAFRQEWGLPPSRFRARHRTPGGSLPRPKSPST